jgi:mitochondrial import receptor subunit TOM40
MLNNVRAITKKVEHIKGFRFEVGGYIFKINFFRGLSNNFHLSNQWNIQGPAAEK